jgi:TetR/AcrR family transcriptional repressor of nem operon
MSIKAEQKLRTHARILDSAMGLIRVRGIGGASVADVMKGAGLTVGGFYAHFGSKEALVEAALRRTGRALREQLFTELESKPEADRALVILKRYVSRAHRDAPGDGCALPAVVGELATNAAAQRVPVAEEIDELVSAFTRHLPALGGVSRRQLALGLFALMYGGLALARALAGTKLSDELIEACRALGAAVLRAPARAEPKK